MNMMLSSNYVFVNKTYFRQFQANYSEQIRPFDSVERISNDKNGKECETSCKLSVQPNGPAYNTTEPTD